MKLAMRSLAVSVLLAYGFAGLASGEEERSGASLPDGMRGFLGLLQGKIVEKGERGFVVQVEKVVKTWEANKAPNPEASVGKNVRFRARPEQKHIVEQLAAVAAGDSVVAGGAHKEGESLQAVEVLVKAAEFPALQAKWEAAARQRTEREAPAGDGNERIRRLERQIEELRKENEALRRKATNETRRE